ncbi:putative oligopeptide transporter, OPT family [Singulisphaera sp. GP187]|uniref:OPT family oligopeptide transporter n=1 Tax=Singulisphaera sp. GP187 TaxID=1882752 RepID=UPI00092642CB|nr:oligopeptide transporter, OPT family [Singulisphaera sp. GP187]SIO64941.1 putative oligopeptide transporter, OPT family [Singulisphaera sp. GP187]
MSVHTPPPAETPSEGLGSAYPVHKPYIHANTEMDELTWSAVLLGAILGIVFGASSLYLVLRVGMTVSASIPVAVLSITVFRAFSKILGTRPATILENNIVQTAGSAGESIAFGLGVTMPALMILGYDLDIVRIMLVAALGGLLGILMMIPLRRAFIVKQHGSLTFPEGTACAKVLIVGEQGGSSAKTVFVGFGLAFVYQVLMQSLRIWQEYPAKAIKGFKGAVVSLESSPVLMGVGYIIGFRIACVMVAGGMMAALVLTPAIAFFGGAATEPIFPGTKLISAMSPKDIRDAYILYIGAGAVATGGIISLFQALPLIVSSIGSGLRDIRLSKRGGAAEQAQRTDRDLPLWMVGLGSIALVAAIASTHLMPTDLPGRLVGAAMVVLFGFLFVTVSSRLTGEIGSSSNPISGMTVATLLLTCLIFVLMGWVGPSYRLAALSIAGIVCIAASNGGTTSQDLKTGFLVGATPRSQQISILVGALTSAVVIGFTLLLLNDASTVTTGRAEYLPTAKVDVATLTETTTYQDQSYHVWRVVNPIPGAQPGKYLVDDQGQARFLIDPAINGRVDTRDDGSKVVKYDAPKATLMALIIDGIMTGKLPWNLVLIGVFIAIVMHLAGVPALAFAVGVYLPFSTSAPIFVGGLVRAVVDKIKRTPAEESDSSPAVLLSSGYIAGGAIAGILIATLAIIPQASKLLDLSTRLPAHWNGSPWPSIVAFSFMTLVLFLVGIGVLLRSVESPAVSEGVKGREEDL